MVAREASPDQVLAAVAEEVGLLLRVEGASIDRYEPDGGCTVVASWGKLRELLEIGSRWKLDGDSASSWVLRTGQPVRFDSYERAWGSIEPAARELRLRSSVASPILVEGRLWGEIFAATSDASPMPADAESRIAQFAELVATAVANVQARSDLAASRARIVAAADEERQRVVRDLHDGAQQRVVQTLLTLKLVRDALDRNPDAVPGLVTEAVDQAQQATTELRELSHGLLPRVLLQGGLRAGVEVLASRMPVPVEIDVTVGRLPTAIEATAYFVVAEALTNVVKHARARSVAVAAHIEDETLRVAVRDDGAGGAERDGSGLLGLRDRLSVLDGYLRVESPEQSGTVLAAYIPLIGR
jgi:signal transduction histidine kinase